ncbi:hypothetical protein PHMEG_00033822 [Phytophthora megakarya]|uniref:Uncharacterized protein n=1 Tax=Phytophthora megakarya TaxID=4795 RepID=A0A225USM5_9STRA|nr:hypothetical protein PHMEG_00033822 [Phytophthora megakarya]
MNINVYLVSERKYSTAALNKACIAAQEAYRRNVSTAICRTRYLVSFPSLTGNLDGGKGFYTNRRRIGSFGLPKMRF